MYLNEERTALVVLSDCPLFDAHGGKCKGCVHFEGEGELFRQGECNLLGKFIPIDQFRERKYCPDLQERNNGANCNHCENFLGFCENRGFYCDAKEK
jgi:hypothetical protein